MFRTELTITPQEQLLPRAARVLTVGSCFAESIGEQLRTNKVATLVNPFGTVFQPLALARLLRAAAGEAQDWQQHVVEARGRWQSYDFHGTVGADSPVELLQTIQEMVRRVGDFLRTADVLVLTLGTAWAYRLRETGELVSNLHKLPASLFEKELLTADELVNGLAEVHALVRLLNPQLRIVLTVSPVRHLKDTLPLNAVSKSVLRVACHYLSELLPGVSYFPAYELLLDDLRDYRFYTTDMLHPSEAAQEYIWDRFARAYFDADFGRFRKEWAAVRQALGHRPLHQGAPEHRAFLDQTQERLEKMASQGVEVRQELRDVQRQLAALPPPRPVKAPQVEADEEERIDIGEEAPAEPIAESPAAEVTSLRPERSRDNQREGRHRDNDRRNGRVAPAADAMAHVDDPLLTPANELLAEATVPPLAPEPAVISPEETAGYPAKKKKRRSRGGAKRTARKNAARLAAEQGDAPLEEAADLTSDEPQHPEATGFAENTPEQEPEEAPFVPADAIAADESAETEPSSAVSAGELPTSARKRGTGPTPKKSKVITKSGVIKRGNRAGLYRAPAPVAEDNSASQPPAVPERAPVISPEAEAQPAPAASSPITSDALPERLTAGSAVPARPNEEPDLAATVLGLFSTKVPTATPKPKRGRPKAAPSVPSPDPADNVPPAELAVPSETPAVKSAPRPKATKPATAKKVATKPAAPRRGRPPGKKDAPAPTDSPAT